MRLVEIDKNILINPDNLDALEYSKYGGKGILYAYVNGKKFTVTVDIKKFLKTVETITFDGDLKQNWAG